MTPGAGGRPSPAPRRLPLAVFLLLLALSACHPRPVAVAAAPLVNADRVSQLQHAIAESLDEPSLSRGTWGVVIRSLDRDEILYERNAQKLLMPASTLKIVTLAVGADLLGWDYRYRTRVLTVGNVEDGVLKGHLLVVGSGDPTLEDWDGSASVLFGQWADRLKAAGIRRIAGSVVGDDDRFEEDGLGTGWAWDDLAHGYATSVGALQFNENTAQLLITPAATAGPPPTVEVKPASAPVQIINRAVTQPLTPESPRAEADVLNVWPVPYSHVIEIRGLAPLGSGTLVRNIAVADPTLYFVSALREALINHGIDVQGPALDNDESAVAIDRAQAKPLAERQSPPLNEIGRTMMKTSQNLFAETVLKTFGNEPGGAGSTAAGLDTILRTLDGWGVSRSDMRLVDGSGLSRYDVITPAALVGILAHVYRDERLRAPFLETLPVAGVDGTLQNRMKGTPAEGNARAKTGSFSNARSVAGFVKTADDEMLTFAIMANNYGVAASAIDRATDAIVAALARFSRR